MKLPESPLPEYRAFLDTETSGLSPTKNFVTEVSVVIFSCKDFTTVSKFQTLLKPDENKEYTEYALKLQNRTLEWLQDAGVEGAEAFGKLIAYLEAYLGDSEDWSGKIWAHNAPFDYGFLSELEKSVSPETDYFQKRNYFACSKSLWLSFRGLGLHNFEKSNLLEICKYLNLAQSQQHRAYSDCLLGIKALKAMKEMLP